jgi:hypothetical protein
VVEAKAEAVVHKAKVDAAKAKAAKAKAAKAKAAKAKARVASNLMATAAMNLVGDTVTKLEIATSAKPTYVMGSMTRAERVRMLRH